MKDITLFYLETCPYCIRARAYMQELMAENPAYRNIPLKMVEERKEKALANSYDYYYVPCYYVDGKKVAEGGIDKAGVKKVLDSALE